MNSTQEQTPKRRPQSWYAMRPIREDLARMGRIGVNPYHVEAWMRLTYGTLDALGGAEWKRAVREAVECVDASTADESERLAESYGLGGSQWPMFDESGAYIREGGAR